MSLLLASVKVYILAHFRAPGQGRDFYILALAFCEVDVWIDLGVMIAHNDECATNYNKEASQ